MKKLLLFATMLLATLGVSAQGVGFTVTDNTLNRRYDLFRVLPPCEGKTVFVGTSPTYIHPWYEAYSRDDNFVNRGVWGASTLDFINNIESVIMAQPSTVILSLGINDGMFDNADLDDNLVIFEDNYRQILHRLVKELPSDAHIYVQELMRATKDGRSLAAIQKANRKLFSLINEPEFKDRVLLIDIYSRIEGITNNQISVDQLNLTAKGYQRWMNAINGKMGGVSAYPANITNDKPAELVFGGALGDARNSIYQNLPVNDDDVMIIGGTTVANGEWSELLGNTKVVGRGQGKDMESATLDQIRQSVTYMKGRAGSACPSHIFVYAGVGDCEHAPQGNVNAIKQAYKQLVDEIHTQFAGAAIHVLTLHKADASYGQYNTNVDLVNTYIKENLGNEISDYTVDVIDLQPALQSVGGRVYVDYGILTGLGYVKMAEVIANALSGEGYDFSNRVTIAQAEERMAMYAARENMRSKLLLAESRAKAYAETNVKIGSVKKSDLITNLINAAYTWLDGHRNASVADVNAYAAQFYADLKALEPSSGRLFESGWYQIVNLEGHTYNSGKGRYMKASKTAIEHTDGHSHEVVFENDATSPRTFFRLVNQIPADKRQQIEERAAGCDTIAGWMHMHLLNGNTIGKEAKTSTPLNPYDVKFYSPDLRNNVEGADSTELRIWGELNYDMTRVGGKLLLVSEQDAEDSRFKIYRSDDIVDDQYHAYKVEVTGFENNDLYTVTFDPSTAAANDYEYDGLPAHREGYIFVKRKTVLKNYETSGKFKDTKIVPGVYTPEIGHELFQYLSHNAQSEYGVLSIEEKLEGDVWTHIIRLQPKEVDFDRVTASDLDGANENKWFQIRIAEDNTSNGMEGAYINGVSSDDNNVALTKNPNQLSTLVRRKTETVEDGRTTYKVQYLLFSNGRALSYEGKPVNVNDPTDTNNVKKYKGWSTIKAKTSATGEELFKIEYEIYEGRSTYYYSLYPDGNILTSNDGSPDNCFFEAGETSVNSGLLAGYKIFKVQFAFEDVTAVHQVIIKDKTTVTLADDNYSGLPAYNEGYLFYNGQTDLKPADLKINYDNSWVTGANYVLNATVNKLSSTVTINVRKLPEVTDDDVMISGIVEGWYQIRMVDMAGNSQMADHSGNNSFLKCNTPAALTVGGNNYEVSFTDNTEDFATYFYLTPNQANQNSVQIRLLNGHYLKGDGTSSVDPVDVTLSAKSASDAPKRIKIGTCAPISGENANILMSAAQGAAYFGITPVEPVVGGVEYYPWSVTLSNEFNTIAIATTDIPSNSYIINRVYNGGTIFLTDEYDDRAIDEDEDDIEFEVDWAIDRDPLIVQNVTATADPTNNIRTIECVAQRNINVSVAEVMARQYVGAPSLSAGELTALNTLAWAVRTALKSATDFEGVKGAYNNLTNTILGYAQNSRIQFKDGAAYRIGVVQSKAGKYGNRMAWLSYKEASMGVTSTTSDEERSSIFIARHIEGDRYMFVNIDNPAYLSYYDASVGNINGYTTQYSEAVNALLVEDMQPSENVQFQDYQLMGFKTIKALKRAANLSGEGVFTMAGELSGDDTAEWIESADVKFDQDATSAFVFQEVKFLDGRPFESEATATYNLGDIRMRTCSLDDEFFWASYYQAYPVDLPEGISMYYCSELSEEGKLKLTALDGDVIPAHTPVVLRMDKQEGDTRSYIPFTLKPAVNEWEDVNDDKSPSKITNYLSGNNLPGELRKLIRTHKDYKNIYVFSGASGTIGFYKAADKYNNGYLDICKAFFYYPQSFKGTVVRDAAQPNNTRGYVFSFMNDIATQVEVVDDKARANAAVYDLQGRKVAKPANGFYIVNGKKTLVK